MARSSKLLLVLPVLALTVAATRPFPASVPLPRGFAPEGIAVGAGSTFYVGSLRDGDIYVGDLRSGDGGLLVDTTGRPAVGLKVDEAHHRLLVAGGPTGRAFVYDTRNGDLLAEPVLTTAPGALLNDVVVTRGGAYFTDSSHPVLLKLPIAPDGSLGTPEPLPLTGPAAAVLDFPNLNGIDATPSGDVLVVGHSQLGVFTVDPSSGESRQITLTGPALTPGFNDGILLAGRTLWVVENFANRLVEIRLSADLARGRVVSVLTNADVDGAFRVPTTVAEHGHRLAIVNGRFDLGLPPPFGAGAPPNTDYDVVLLDKP
jgi:hypothetical protein